MSTKIKSNYKKYIVYLIIFIVYTYLRWRLSEFVRVNQFSFQSKLEFLRYPENINIVYYFRVILDFIFGCLLGFDMFILKLKNEGKWKFNFSKAALIILPFLIFMIIRYFTPKLWFSLLVYYCSTYISILVGYMLVTCFYKESLQEINIMNTTIKSNYKKYIVYLTIFTVYIYLRYKLYLFILENQTTYFKLPESIHLLFYLKVIPNIIFGCLLGLNIFILEIKKAGKRKLNFHKVALMIIPFLILIIVRPFTSKLFTSQYFNYLSPYFSMMIGYMGVTCFYKETLDESNVPY